MAEGIHVIYPCGVCFSIFQSKRGLDQHVGNCIYMRTYHPWYNTVQNFSTNLTPHQFSDEATVLPSVENAGQTLDSRPQPSRSPCSVPLAPVKLDPVHETCIIPSSLPSPKPDAVPSLATDLRRSIDMDSEFVFENHPLPLNGMDHVSSTRFHSSDSGFASPDLPSANVANCTQELDSTMRVIYPVPSLEPETEETPDNLAATENQPAQSPQELRMTCTDPSLILELKEKLEHVDTGENELAQYPQELQMTCTDSSLCLEPKGKLEDVSTAENESVQSLQEPQMTYTDPSLKLEPKGNLEDVATPETELVQSPRGLQMDYTDPSLKLERKGKLEDVATTQNELVQSPRELQQTCTNPSLKIEHKGNQEDVATAEIELVQSPQKLHVPYKDPSLKLEPKGKLEDVATAEKELVQSSREVQENYTNPTLKVDPEGKLEDVATAEKEFAQSPRELQVTCLVPTVKTEQKEEPEEETSASLLLLSHEECPLIKTAFEDDQKPTEQQSFSNESSSTRCQRDNSGRTLRFRSSMKTSAEGVERTKKRKREPPKRKVKHQREKVRVDKRLKEEACDQPEETLWQIHRVSERENDNKDELQKLLVPIPKVILRPVNRIGMKTERDGSRSDEGGAAAKKGGLSSCPKNVQEKKRGRKRKTAEKLHQRPDGANKKSCVRTRTVSRKSRTGDATNRRQVQVVKVEDSKENVGSDGNAFGPSKELAVVSRQNGSLHSDWRGSPRKRATCHICGRKFIWAAHRDRHLISHTDVKSYPCTLCPAVLKFPDGLDRHMQNIHHRRPRRSL